VKRKISAILAADIAGYSKLVAEDEEETLQRLGTYRAVFDDFVARSGGRIFNTAGDAVLSEFPSSVDAVRCAVDIQESIRTHNLAYSPSRQMSFRIGITVADVVEREGDLLGDGVNVAARLGDIATPGGICVSHIVYEQVVNKLSIKFQDLGQKQVKNLPNAIHAYGIIDHAEKSPRASPRQRRMLWLTGLAFSGALAGAAVMLSLKLHFIGGDVSVAGTNPTVQLSGEQTARPLPANYDEAKVRAFAASQSIPLPPTLKVMAPAAAVPPLHAAYVGAWGGDERWNGTGRQSILVIESIDSSGTALGVLGFGPPIDSKVPDQRQARYRSIAGTISDEGLVFTLANINYTFKSTSDGLMWGHMHANLERGGTIDMSITIERIE
jgi:class 3 adenylate cyclase